MFSKKDGFLFSFIVVGKCFKIFGREVTVLSLLMLYLSKTLAVLAVSITGKGIHNAFQLWLVSIFLDCCGCEYTKKVYLNFFPSPNQKLKNMEKQHICRSAHCFSQASSFQLGQLGQVSELSDQLHFTHLQSGCGEDYVMLQR